MRRFSPLLGALSALVALSACASGGSSSASPPPPAPAPPSPPPSPAPPPPPPAPPQPSIAFTGPLVGTRIVKDTAGVVTNVAPTQLLEATSNVGIGILQGASGPGETSDLVFRILDLRGEELDQIADELTYVFPTAVTAIGAGEELITFGVFGTRSGPLPSTLPERYLGVEGTAGFVGRVNGIFSDVDKRLYRTHSDIQFQANFATDRIFASSGPTRILGLSNPSSPTAPLASGAYLDFRLDASINEASMSFSGRVAQLSPNPVWGSMTGSASGLFFGAAGRAPDEIGFAFEMATPDGRVRYFGVGAGDHELGSRPFLTPLTTVNSGQGPSVMVTGAGIGISGTRGAGSSITASTLLNTSPNVTASFLPGATMGFRDDTFSLDYDVNGVDLAYSWQYPGFDGTDGFGTAYTTMVGGNGNPVYDVVHHNIGFDLGPSLAGALDNVFLVSIMGDKFSTTQTYGHVVFGTQTAPIDMPTNGSASFTGETRGVYLDSSGQLFRTGGDLSMTANFSSGAISGAATNFLTVGDYFPGNSTDKLDFTFAGNINSVTSTFGAVAGSAAGGIGLTGSVEGAFYGNRGQAPDEAGIAYQLGTPGSGAFMAGGGLMVRN